ncbi:E2/UBC family protein [Acidisoma silvae]|uniref:Uncharacterized protein n=1 Tax=Acidisoma silvae TaxID=2802396 RepID=A0A964E1D5_9PROT|nr:E2/UBC family protein [Acidisoma silvae]MCB8878460.1 hypothetical protein [Acidisoma silvae]
MRKAFQLSEEDEECLAQGGRVWEAIREGNANWLILPGHQIPDGYNVSMATAALRIPPNYPDDQIDMVYFDPPIALKSGRTIANLSLLTLDGRQYQQWSRHRTPANPWRPGIDNVCTHLLQVDTWLQRELAK